MKLSLDYLYHRYDFWKLRLAEAGIWKISGFYPVTIVIRKNHKRYNAVFQRRIKLIGGKREITDKIVFYNKVADFNPQFIDNVLVHEMVHQYIIQNDIKDTSSHGKVFKSFMEMINKAFKDELEIKIKDQNPDLPLYGAGELCHTLLVMHLKDDKCIVAVINPSRILYFQNLLNNSHKSLGVRSYEWAESNDVYFTRFSRCTSRLHGISLSKKELLEFCKRLNIRILQISNESLEKKKKSKHQRFFSWL